MPKVLQFELDIIAPGRFVVDIQYLLPPGHLFMCTTMKQISFRLLRA
jgi:hypothetical protein